MQYLVYINDNCQAEANKHNLYEELTKTKEKVEKTQTISNFDRFLPSPYTRKKVKKNFRLVAVVKEVDNFKVICFLKFLARSSKVYNNWLVDNHLFDSMIPTDLEISNYINSLESTTDGLPELSEDEYQYLLNCSNTTLSETSGLIIEHKQWVNKTYSKDWRKYLDSIHTTLVSLIEKKNSNKNDIITSSEGSFSIHYKYFESFDSYLLLDIVRKKKDKNTAEQYKAAFTDINIANIIEDDLDSILSIGQKSYPSYIVFDEAIWFNIQENTEGNIALSPEETAIVNSIRENNDKKFPVFINGRPGSGKSTILQYLFSDQISYYLNNVNASSKNLNPIYITYSESLLEVARKNVWQILTSNSQKLENHIIDISKNKEEVYNRFSQCFTTFRGLLIESLPVNIRQNYSFNRFIDYGKFKNLWNQDITKHPEARVRKLNPEIAWHVIRSFIKGMSSSKDEYLDYESYKSEIPSERKTIPNEVYELIFTKIWESWYQRICVENHYWDEQDLVRAALDNDTETLRKHSAVFCDEAQDFTLIELEFLINLSIYKDRNTPPQYLKNVPFVFAGDPFQTLNPTGFNWDSVKSSFHEKLVEELEKFNKIQIEFNYQELNYNYRSTEKIVNFSNLIQILRGILFNIKNLIPQKTWQNENSFYPEYFDDQDPLVEEALISQQEMAIIVPCQEGEELSWAKTDPLLSKIAIQNGELIRNVLSPMRAKGHEFNKVIIYKFGDRASKEYKIDIENSVESIYENLSPEELIRIEYFINNLYVALSRAKIRLYIVDTEVGFERFWGELKINYEILFLKYQEIANHSTNIWEAHHVNEFHQGREILKDEDNDDPLQIAQSFEKHGIMRKSHEDLVYAEQNYKRAGHATAAKRAKALGFSYKEDFEKAANLFLEIKNYEDAIDNYWKAKSFNKLKSIGAMQKDYSNHYKIRVATFIDFNENYEMALEMLSLTCEEDFIKLVLKEVYEGDQWNIFLDKLVTTALNYAKGENDNLQWRRINEIISEINSSLPRLLNFNHMAEIAYYADEKEVAVHRWEQIPEDERPKIYQEAKAELLEFPDNLIWYNSLGDSEKICQLYINNRVATSKISETDKHIIIGALFNKSKFDLLHKLCLANNITKFSSTTTNQHDFINFVLSKNDLSFAIKLILNNISESDIKKLLKNKNTNLSLSFHLVTISAFLISLKLNNDWKEFSKLIRGNYDKIYNVTDSQQIIIWQIANFLLNNAKKSDLDNNSLETLSVLFREKYKSKKIVWANLQQFKFFSKVFEKIGRYIELLPFYESIIEDSNATDDEKDFAKERWIRVKLNQKDLLKQGKYSNKIDVIDKEIKNKFDEWNLIISYANENEVPNLIKLQSDLFEMDTNDFCQTIILDFINKTETKDPQIEKISGTDVIKSKSKPETMKDIIIKDKKSLELQVESKGNQIIEPTCVLKTEIIFPENILYKIEHSFKKGKTKIIKSPADEFFSYNHSNKKITCETEFTELPNKQKVYSISNWDINIEITTNMIVFIDANTNLVLMNYKLLIS